MVPVPDASPLPPAKVDRLVEELKKDVDRTLIRENLKLTVEERLLKLMSHQRFVDELQRAGRELRRRPARTAEADVTPPSPALGVAEALQGADAPQARDNG